MENAQVDSNDSQHSQEEYPYRTAVRYVPRGLSPNLQYESTTVRRLGHKYVYPWCCRFVAVGIDYQRIYHYFTWLSYGEISLAWYFQTIQSVHIRDAVSSKLG